MRKFLLFTTWIPITPLCVVCVAWLAWSIGCASIIPSNYPPPKDATGVRELDLGHDGSIVYIRRVEIAWWGVEGERVEVGDVILRPAFEGEGTSLGRVANYQALASMPYFSESSSPYRFFVTSFPGTYASRPRFGRYLQRVPGLCAYIVDEDMRQLRRILGSGLPGRDRGFPNAFNVVNSCVPVNGGGSKIASRLSGFASSPKLEMPVGGKPTSSRSGHIGVYSLLTGQLEYGLTAPGGAYTCFQLPKKELIWSKWQGGETSNPAVFSLMEGNSMVVPNIIQLLAITPDCLRVFFTVLAARPDNLKPTLVSYGTETGVLNTLTSWSGYSDLRIRSDSEAFGVLNVCRRGNRMIVQGCRIMDLKGRLIEDIRLTEPIIVVGTGVPVYIGPRAYDWDLDSQTIAYWHESSNAIVIQRFDGTILDSFTP